MKLEIQKRNRKFLKAVGLLSAATIASGIFANAQETNAVKAADEKKSESTTAAPGEFNNWIDFSFGNYFVNGDQAQFQRRFGLPAGPFGGIEDFHVETP